MIYDFQKNFKSPIKVEIKQKDHTLTSFKKIV